MTKFLVDSSLRSAVFVAEPSHGMPHQDSNFTRIPVRTEFIGVRIKPDGSSENFVEVNDFVDFIVGFASHDSMHVRIIIGTFIRLLQSRERLDFIYFFFCRRQLESFARIARSHGPFRTSRTATNASSCPKRSSTKANEPAALQ